MKRFLIILLIFVLTFSFVGCGPKKEGSAQDKLSVVSTIFPSYDFARTIAGENAEVTLLLPPGAESHSFEPTPQDILKIQNCDLFIYVGGDSDTWVANLLDSMDTSKMKIISMTDLVETVAEEIVEGMEEDHDHDHDDFKPEDVQNRSLVEWNGDWSSIHLNMDNDAFSPYYEAKSNELNISFAETINKYQAHWSTDYPDIKVSGNKVTFKSSSGEVTADYRANGFEVIETDSGAYRVWYNYETDAKDAPKRIIFNDHGYKPVGDDEHEEHLAHYHLKYGNASAAELIAQSDWVPTYFPAGTTAAEQAEVMIDHLPGNEHDHDIELDEHVWTSPVNAMHITEAIADALCLLDEENKDTYRKNQADYISQLKNLDASFREVTENAVRKTLVFGDRFPFRYFADEYGIDYYAAFPGCATESEPSAQTIAFLIDKVKEENIPVVFYIEFSNEKMADTICEATNAKKLLLHSCHNVSKDDLKKGLGYVELMTQNVENLKEALL